MYSSSYLKAEVTNFCKISPVDHDESKISSDQSDYSNNNITALLLLLFIMGRGGGQGVRDKDLHSLLSKAEDLMCQIGIRVHQGVLQVHMASIIDKKNSA